MSTITLEDVQQTEITKRRVIHYSPTINQASWELYCGTPQERGAWAERIVAERIQRHTGYECSLYRKAWDITVNHDHVPVRVEVKSSIYRNRSGNSYKLEKIKCECFDYIFIVLISPQEVILKWAETKDIKRDLEEGNTKCNDGGYTLSVHINKIPEYFNDLEDFTFQNGKKLEKPKVKKPDVMDFVNADKDSKFEELQINLKAWSAWEASIMPKNME